VANIAVTVEYQRRLKRTSSMGLATMDQKPGEIVIAVIAEIVASGTWRAFRGSGTEVTRIPPYMPKGALVMPISHRGTARRRSAGTVESFPPARLTATPNGRRLRTGTVRR